MRTFAPFLRDQFGITPPESNHLASTIADEIRSLPPETLRAIVAEDSVGPEARLCEIQGFQMFMDIVGSTKAHPAVVRAQVITQNYICFVYLGEACFRLLRRAAPDGSVTKRCCRLLTDNPVRAFRNALAHANWTYRADFSGLVFWARKGSDPNEALTRFEVGHNDLNFWQALSRCVAYVTYTLIADRSSDGSSSGG